MTESSTIARVERLGKSYGGRSVVRDLSFNLRGGQLLGLVGANGGGKTTTLRMLAGLLRPDVGSGQVLGHDIARPIAAFRARIGYMAQRLALYPDLTVAENLRFRAAAYRLPSDAAAAVISRFNLQPVLHTRFDRLSGGWARRAQFAATLIHSPRLLLLDEPTAGLDPLTRRDLWRWLDAAAAEGAAIIVSTHDLVEAERFPVIIHYDRGSVMGPMPPGDLAAASGAASLEAAVLALAERGP